MDLLSEVISSTLGALLHSLFCAMMILMCFVTSQPTPLTWWWLSESSGEVLILEVGCTFDHSLEEAFLTELLKYQQLKQTISPPGLQV